MSRQLPPPKEETPKIEISTSQSSPVFDTAGGSAQVSFTATDAWTATTSAATRAVDWCSVSPTSGNAGAVTLTVTTTANDTPDERRATVTLRSGTTSKSFTVTQKQKDALTVTANRIEVNAEGGTATIEVKANISYQYEIEEAARTWLTAASTRGLSTSTIKLDVAENDSQNPREAKVTVYSGDLKETVIIYQLGSEPTIVLTEKEYSVGSGETTITVELTANIDYEVQLPADGWIKESTTRAFTAYTHHFTIAENDTYDARTAEISFVNKANNITEKVKVTQAQMDAIKVSKTEYTVAAAGETIDIKYSANVEVKAETSVDWIQQATTRGLTEKALHFTVSENTSESSREGTITLSSGDLKQTVKVTQQAKSVFSISKNEFTVSSADEQIKVEVTANGEYTVQLPNVAWITEGTTTTQGTVKTHTFNIAKNDTYDARSAEITFTDKATGAVEKVKVTQAQLDAIKVDKTEYTVAAAGETIDIKYSANVEVKAETSVDWILQATTRGLTDRTLRFTITENTSDTSREGTITLSSGDLKQTVKVTQQAKSVFSISKNEFTVSSADEQIKVEVTANGEYTVQLPNVAWITEGTTTTQGTVKTHTINIAKNDTYDARSAEITFTDKATGAVEKVKVTQAQLDAIKVSKTEYTVAAAGETIDVAVTANVVLTVSCSVNWITQVTTRGLTDRTLRFTVAKNPYADQRAGTITLSGGNLQQTIKVVQRTNSTATGGGIDDMPTQEWK